MNLLANVTDIRTFAETEWDRAHDLLDRFKTVPRYDEDGSPLTLSQRLEHLHDIAVLENWLD